MKKFLLYAGLGCVGLVLWALSGQIGRFVGKSAIENYQQGKMQGAVEKAQEIAAEQIRKQLPIQVDEVTTLYNVMVSGRALIYQYRMKRYKDRIDLDNFHSEMLAMLKYNVCNEKGMRWGIDNGGSFVYYYIGLDGLLIDEITINSSSC